MTALQVFGSLLAIPVGLASAYSIYHANFTAEARCDGLRANIVSMLDKSADASTLRMLVRRDVVAFEKTCGAVDPDAVAAFKTLLARKAAVPAVARPQQAAREPVPVKEAAKPAAVKTSPAAVEKKPARRDAATSDANWVASVREALIHSPEARPETAEPPEPAAAAMQPAMPAPSTAQPMPQPRIIHEAPRPAAPALSLPMPIAAAPALAADHPVPPGSIPDTAPADQLGEKSNRSWIAKIPLLNRVVGQ